MSEPIAPIPGAAPDMQVPVNASGTPSGNTTLVPRKDVQSADPAWQPYNHPVYAPKERCGACYGLSVAFEAHVDPTAGFTQANGRLFQSAINRSAPNFYQGIVDHS